MTNSPAKVVVLCAVTAAATMSPRCSLACIHHLLHPSFSQRSQILPSSALQDILRTIAGGECTFDYSISTRMVTVYRIFKLTRTCCHRQKQAHVRSSIEVSRQIWAEDKPGECLNFLCGHFAADLCIRLFLRSIRIGQCPTDDVPFQNAYILHIRNHQAACEQTYFAVRS